MPTDAHGPLTPLVARKMWASLRNHNCCSSSETELCFAFLGLPESPNPSDQVAATIKHQLTCRSSCMRSFMAAEIPPVACRPPRLLDGRGDDGAGRRPTRWSETERGEDARLSAVIVFFSPPPLPPLQTLGWWNHFWRSRVTRTKGEARPSAVNPLHADDFLLNQRIFWV